MENPANELQTVRENVNVLDSAQENQENAVYIDFKMVTFSLAGKDYAIDIMHVKEIAKAGRFTYVPNTLPFVLGVYNLRGEIIPILDLRIFFNIDVPERDENKLENLLILSIGDRTFGLVVDKIDKVVGVQKSSIQPPHPLFGDINIKYISGVVESNNRLYVLLDVMRIFSIKEAGEKEELVYKPNNAAHETPKADAAPAGKSLLQKAAAAEQPKPTAADIDIKFIIESLKQYKGFYSNPVNETWIKQRFKEWQEEGKAQLQNPADADEFLKGINSSFTGTWWSKQYAQNVKAMLPENSAKQIVVWNPGCGKGIESYCLACVLKEKYPDAKIRIYAQDIDLMSISTAGMLTVPQQVADDWFEPYVVKTASGEYTFSQEIKDCVMFEYHDFKNSNVLPMVDIIFARDVLSYIDEESVDMVLNDFVEKMKGNAVTIVGENEYLPVAYGFREFTVDSLVGYTKD